MGLTEDVIDAFEFLFFNVVDRLDSPGWVTHKVVGKKLHSGLTADDVDVLWKFYGYHGGPHILDELITDFADTAKPQSAGEVQPFFDDDLRRTILRRAAIAIRTLSLEEPKVCIKLLKLWIRLRELDAKRTARSSAHDVIHIHAGCDFMLKNVDDNFSKARSGIENKNGIGHVNESLQHLFPDAHELQQ